MCDAAPPSSRGNTLCSSGGVPTPHTACEADEDSEGDDARLLPGGLGEKMRSAAAAAETEGGGGLAAAEVLFAAAAAAADDEDEEPCAPPLPI